MEEMHRNESVEVDEAQHKLLLKVLKDNETSACNDFEEGFCSKTAVGAAS